MKNSQASYRSLRLKDDEYQRIKDLQRYLRRKGTDTVDWQELRRQNIIELPDDKVEDSIDDLTMGSVVGLGAAALAYLIWKGAQR
jgi:hypothetical protein